MELLEFVGLAKNNGIFIDIYVQPNAKHQRLYGIHNRRLKVQLSSAPIDGNANRELIQVMSKILKISKSSIKMVSGDTSRNKRIVIVNSDINVINEILAASLN